MSGNGGWMGAGMWLFWIVLVVIIVLLVRVLAGGDSASPAAPRRDSPLDILKARYARGEIDDKEFQRRRRELEK